MYTQASQKLDYTRYRMGLGWTAAAEDLLCLMTVVFCSSGEGASILASCCADQRQGWNALSRPSRDEKRKNLVDSSYSTVFKSPAPARDCGAWYKMVYHGFGFDVVRSPWPTDSDEHFFYE